MIVLLRLFFSYLPLRRLKREAARNAQPLSVRELTHMQLAFLAGGPKRALLTSLSALAPGASRQSLGDPLFRRLQFLGVTNSELTAEKIATEARPELDALGETLVARHLVLDPTRVGPLRKIDSRLGYIGWAIAALVFAAEWFREHDLTMAGYAAGFIIVPQAILSMILRPGNLRLRAARDLVSAAQQEFAYLDPKHHPQYQAYGPWALSLGTALFGGAVLAGIPQIAPLPMFQSLLTAQSSHVVGSSGCSTSSFDCGTDSGNGCGGSCSGGDSSCGGGGCGGCGGD